MRTFKIFAVVVALVAASISFAAADATGEDPPGNSNSGEEVVQPVVVSPTPIPQPGPAGPQGSVGHRGSRGARGARGPAGQAVDIDKLDKLYEEEGPYRGKPERQKGLIAWFRSIGGITAGEVDQKIANANTPASPDNDKPDDPAKGGSGMPLALQIVIGALAAGALAVGIIALCTNGNRQADLVDAIGDATQRLQGSERLVASGSRNRFRFTVEPANATPMAPPAPTQPPVGGGVQPGVAWVPVQVSAGPVGLVPAGQQTNNTITVLAVAPAGQPGAGNQPQPPQGGQAGQPAAPAATTQP